MMIRSLRSRLSRMGQVALAGVGRAEQAEVLAGGDPGMEDAARSRGTEMSS
jgi:hypothetical protein